MKRLAVSVVAAAMSASLAACADSSTLLAPTSRAPEGAASLSTSSTRLSSPLVSGASGQCLTTVNGSAAIVTPGTVAPCAGSTAQLVDLPAVGTAGAVVLYGGAVCLDDFGAQGRVGDVVGVYTCVAGAATQTWTLTSTGTLTGVNGLCVAAGASGASLTLQRCDGSAGQQWTASAAPTPAPTPTPTPPPTTRFTAPLVSGASGQCLATVKGSAAAVTASTVAPCVASAADQALSLPPVGTAGPVLLFSGTMCLDDFGAQGRVGDVVGIYTCVASAPSQRWTLTSAGAVTGINGLCVAASGTSVTLQPCDASAGQRWSTTAPATPTTPVPTPSTPTGTAAVFGLLGSVPSVSSVQAHGATWSRYESDFATYSESHWTSDGASYDSADFYDRAMIYYVWWARTGNATYLDRANQLAINSRSYLESAKYYPQPYMMMIDGVALHALVTGDPQSVVTVGRVADELMSPQTYWSTALAQTSNPEIDNRTQARLLTVLLDAWYLHAPSQQGNDWAARLRDVLTRTLGTQSPDGAYRWAAQCSYNKPFMVGMLNDALMRYYTTFEADARIVPAVKRSLDYMWANDWLAPDQAFTYIDGPCTGQTPGAAGDLNNMIVSGFGFVAKQTGDAAYFSKGDAVFAGGVANAWLAGSKQFNQEYTTSFRYLGLRW